jgi:hypothetical protein
VILAGAGRGGIEGAEVNNAGIAGIAGEAVLAMFGLLLDL